ncbi:MAG: hypothetical protein P8Z70_07895 [Desulfuromonadales bacterium]
MATAGHVNVTELVPPVATTPVGCGGPPAAAAFTVKESVAVPLIAVGVVESVAVTLKLVVPSPPDSA